MRTVKTEIVEVFTDGGVAGVLSGVVLTGYMFFERATHAACRRMGKRGDRVRKGAVGGVPDGTGKRCT